MKKFQQLCVPAVAVMSVVFSASARANLISNPSFESATNQSVSSHTVQNSELGTSEFQNFVEVNSAGVTNWSADNRIWYVHSTGTTAFPDGSWAVRIDSLYLPAVPGLDEKDVLAQSGLTLSAGITYQLSFAMWGEGSAVNKLSVRLTDDTANMLDETAGTDVINVLNGQTMIGNDGFYDTITATFTPTVSHTYAIQFFNPDGTGDHIWIDNVNLDAVPTPEPNSFIILGIGAVGLLAARRRRRME